MAQLLWDQAGQRFYETGVDRGVLYINNNGIYDTGYAWNGLTTVTESPSGADATPQYADNIKYLNLVAAEDFGGTIEAFTYPDQFAQCDGTVQPNTGVSIGQQVRKTFGLSYRSRVGNDSLATDFGYKVHLVWGALAAPSEKAYGTINDTPEGIAFSWTFTTSPVAITALTGLRPTAIMTIESAKVSATALANLEAALYGTAGQAPRLPLPDEVIQIFAGTQTVVTASAPAYNASTHTITIPTVVGVTYRRADTNAIVANGSTIVLVTGQQLVINAAPASGAYTLSPTSDDDWAYIY